MKLHLSYLTPAMLVAMVIPTGEFEGTQPPGPVNVKIAAKRVDRLIEVDIRRARLTPNAIADDATFLRRAYLGILGRIPTAVESVAFLNSQEETKRPKLVDTLLDSPGYASHMFNFWADLLRVKTRLNNQVSGEPFIHFLKKSIADNKPYDEMVHDMLSAKGPAHRRDNGATGLLLRDRGMPLDSMANTVRVFLGTRLECAQCHNHPFDKWKQKDFFQMAAFTGGISYRQNYQNMKGAPGVREVFQELRKKNDRNGMRALGRMMRPVSYGINGTGTGKIRLPKDYKYDDAKPREIVKAHAIFGKNPKIRYPTEKKSKRKGWRERQAERRRRAMQRNRRNRGRLQVPELNTREAYADWLTSPKNPRFTKVIANRMWKLVMGRALIEPVDNIMDATESSNEALMRYLEKLMVDVDYDLEHFMRILFNTTTFQRLANKDEVPDDQKYYFRGPVLRRMTAEQTWDSMLTFVVPELDKKLTKPEARANRVYDQYERLISMSPEELKKQVATQKLRFSDPKKFRRLQQQRRRSQMSQMQQQRQERQKLQADISAKARPLYRQLNRARRAKDAKKIDEIRAKLKELGIDIDRRGRFRGRRGRRGGPTALVRASDIQHPAPNGHFLRKFGQSDRDQIQASHTEANVPQVLSLLNGFIDQRVVSNPSSPLMQTVLNAQTNKDKVRLAYLGILSREPRGRESAVWEHDIDQFGDRIVKDLVWTLVNSHEFRFIQ